MWSPNRYLIVAAAALVQGCGGGDAPAASALNFVVDYLPAPSAVHPAGAVLVSPPAGQRTIGTNDIASVELLLFGQTRQVLSSPNSEPKDNPQLRYVFTVPSTFAPGLYACGTGQFLSEVRVTDVTGFILSKRFELCPGTESEITAP
jgi:hypothetical protein